MGANDWHSLDQLAKNSTIQVTRLSRSSSSYHRDMGLSVGGQAEPTAPWGGDTHIYGLVTEILDVLGAHVEWGLAGHQEHCNDRPLSPPQCLEGPGRVWDEVPPSPEQPGEPRQSKPWVRYFPSPSRCFLSPPLPTGS